MKIVNCGCGRKYSTRMINLDFVSDDTNVITCNLLEGLPFKNNSIDWIYCSHFLEHLTKTQAERFLIECRRVLKNNGGVRIVIPNLEDICVEYLKSLEKVRLRDNKRYHEEYEYSVILLLDQMVRQETGGELLKYWKTERSDKSYIIKRSGKNVIQESNTKVPPIDYRVRFYFDFIHKNPVKAIRYIIKSIFHKSFKIIFGRTQLYKRYQGGVFAYSGELHKWMYDDYSLSVLLKEQGFIRINRKTFNESDIPDFNKMGLETDDNGEEYKPNSLYMEAYKGI